MSGFGGFGQQQQPSSGFGFGGGGGFGQQQQPQPQQQQQQQHQQPSFGFGQQQQQPPSSGFGGGATFGSSPTPAAPPAGFGSAAGGGFGQSAPTMAFGASGGGGGFGATVNTSGAGFGAPSTGGGAGAGFGFGQPPSQPAGFAQAQPQQQQSSGFGQPSSAMQQQSQTGFSGFGGAQAPALGAPAPLVFGSSPTVVGKAAGTGQFGDPPAPTAGFAPASGAAATGFGSGFGNALSGGAVGGFGSAPLAAPAGTPSGGYGLSSSTGGFGGAGFGSGQTGGGGGGMGFGSIPVKTDEEGMDDAPTASSGGFGTSGFGTSVAAPAAAMTDASSSSPSSPFGQRIPRKSPKKETPGKEWVRGGGTEEKESSSSSSEAAAAGAGGGDEKLAALRARIQAKQKKLQQLKHQNKQGGGESSPKRDGKDQESSNAELAARNALRFAASNSGDRDRALNSLLPPDLKARPDNNNNAENGSDNNAWSTPVDSGEEEDDLDLRNLSNAKSLGGTCRSMCPDEELLRRQKEGDIQLLELTDPGGLHPKEWTLRDTAVKRFRRSAADFKLDIPELVRPPEVLEWVCGYLEEWVMERDRQGPDKRWAQSQQTTSDTPPPLDVYQFIWDRTRMIRKDFILQNYIGTGGRCDARAVRCHERIARWHAMSEHQLSHIPDFVSHQSQQNVAELGQTMKTLNMFYDDALGRSLAEETTNGGEAGNGPGHVQGCGSDVIMGKSPVDFDGTPLANTAQSKDVSTRIIGANGVKSSSRGTAEPEMRGLYILLTLNNEGGMEVLKYSGRLCVQRPAVFYSRPVQLALSIFQAKKDHNYARFFSLLRSPSTPYLFSCIMFKYVENMRKDALMIMSKTYGAKSKTTGAAFYDEYPITNLIKLLCYEDEEEARTACRHYGITVEGDNVLWRHSKFREPRDPEKGIIIPLKPRKMMRTIEAKLEGATRLSICRGGVSGEGATLSRVSCGGDAAAAEADRKKARETAERERKEAAERRSRAEAEARARAKKLEEEGRERERLEAARRAQAEAEERAKAERLERERIERERILAERRQKEEEARRLAEAKLAAERVEREREEREAQEREAARRRAEEEARERERQKLLAKQREEEARRQARLKAEAERVERERQEREDARRQAELRRKAEEERVCRVREEEARRIENEWREKIERARKVLAWRLWRKQMRRRESLEGSSRCLESLDPTSTVYPASLRMGTLNAPNALSMTSHGYRGGPIVARNNADEDVLENEMYRLATASRHPINLSEMVAECFVKCPTVGTMHPPGVQSNKNLLLFKLAIFLPKRTGGAERTYNTLRMWVNSHLRIGHVLSHSFMRRSHQVEVRAVAVIGNEDSSGRGNCNAALFMLPSVASTTSWGSCCVDFPEEAEELLGGNVPRMVFVLDDGRSGGAKNEVTENTLDHLVGKVDESDGIAARRGVVAPQMLHFNSAFEKCCETLVNSYFESVLEETRISSHICPSLARTSLADLGFLCLQGLIQNMDAEGFFGRCTSSKDFFSLCEKTLNLMIEGVSRTSNEVHREMQNWPPLEFREEGTSSLPVFFEGQQDLPFDWHLPVPDIKRKVFGMFEQLLETEYFAVLAERFAKELSPPLGQNLLVLLDNGEFISCFANVVSLFVNGELNVVTDEEMLLYLPTESMSQIIRQAASYEAPLAPELVLTEIPSYLYQKSIMAEEKENSPKNMNETPLRCAQIANKRKPRDVEQTPKEERVKRVRSNDPDEATEELRRSREFTSLLKALL